MKTLSSILLMLYIACLLSCTTITGVESQHRCKEGVNTAYSVEKKQDSGVKYSKLYTDIAVAVLYVLLLVASCVYFGYTRKRSVILEAPLKAISPRLGLAGKLLRMLARVFVALYLKVKK